MATINVKDAAGATVALEKPLVPGQTTMANSRPVAIASDQSALNVGTVGGQSPAYGTGASGAAVQRVVIASDQLGSLGQAAMSASAPVVIASDQSSVRTIAGGYEYETVAASQTDQIMGATGAVGDYIEGLVCVVATAATSQVQIKDGNGSAITVLPNAVGAGVGTYYVPLGLKCIMPQASALRRH